jgi:hypothetical protein
MMISLIFVIVGMLVMLAILKVPAKYYDILGALSTALAD